MKKTYQIESQRAVKLFAEMAAEGNPAVQMVLPLAEMIGWLRKGVGELIRQAGLQLMDLLMQEEVRELAGERSQRQPHRTASRWGSEKGYCVVMGQKVPIQRPRVRTTDEQEVRLGSYEMFHRGEPLTQTVWEKLMLGLSTRKYGQAVREFSAAYGLEKSAISEHFIEASREKLQAMMERRLNKTRNHSQRHHSLRNPLLLGWKELQPIMERLQVTSLAKFLCPAVSLRLQAQRNVNGRDVSPKPGD